MPEGTVIQTYSRGGPKYDKIIIDGTDKTLFKAVQIDPDDKPDNGYKMGSATMRPLPAGTYRYKNHSQDYIYVPCNFLPYHSYVLEKVVVNAPSGSVLHELFFDPVTVGTAVVCRRDERRAQARILHGRQRRDLRPSVAFHGSRAR